MRVKVTIEDNPDDGFDWPRGMELPRVGEEIRVGGAAYEVKRVVYFPEHDPQNRCRLVLGEKEADELPPLPEPDESEEDEQDDEEGSEDEEEDTEEAS